MRYHEITLKEAVEEPAFEHDCSACIFVGGDSPQPGEPPVNQVDMYVHRGPSSLTLIRRYGSEPADYASRSYPVHSERYERVMDAARKVGVVNEAQKPLKKFRVAWGKNQHAKLGDITVDAKDEREARKLVRQQLEAMFFQHHGMKILYTTEFATDI